MSEDEKNSIGSLKILGEKEKTYCILDIDIDQDLYDQLLEVGKVMIMKDSDAIVEYAIVKSLENAIALMEEKEKKEKEEKEEN